jgi:hypothetical protein
VVCLFAAPILMGLVPLMSASLVDQIKAMLILPSLWGWDSYPLYYGTPSGLDPSQEGTLLGGISLGTILANLMRGPHSICMGGFLNLLVLSLLSLSLPTLLWFNMGGFLMVQHLWRHLLADQVLSCGLCPMWMSDLLHILT